ncbi:cupredoxin family protein (plasmid) [Roseivivax marinus]|uniref:cupredoxin domain-containing protein n=1 Tax=Roseivivax marinus TaxID=1379903 RepID=UPI001F04A440|nr:cupredoxin family protein [Roseivivax marinus]UMA67371.1 cupredoxin family protein [Roseivivax marinus]
MKTGLITLAMAIAPFVAHAAGTHSGGHGHDEMALGKPAESEPSRTVEVIMKEDYDGENIYIFDKDKLTFAAGETVRLHIVNAGEEVHEFVMDTAEANAEHKAMMAKFPEMEHDDPNAVRLNPGEEADIVWTYGEQGTYEFACLLPGHYEAGMHGPLIIE